LRQFDYEKISYKDITNNAKINFSEVDLETASNYSVEDVYITDKLYRKQLEELTPEDKKILEEIDFPLLEVLRIMENN
jgi:DNA polymerase I-like protein with 3'-5' exonuclease and polymerase domains